MFALNVIDNSEALPDSSVHVHDQEDLILSKVAHIKGHMNLVQSTEVAADGNGPILTDGSVAN